MLATSTTVIVFVTVVFVAVSTRAIEFHDVASLGMPICVSLAFSIILALGVIPMTMNRSGLLKRGQTSRLRRRLCADLRRRCRGAWRRSAEIAAGDAVAADGPVGESLPRFIGPQRAAACRTRR
jgi:multidrug efflux pump subunit AcrB